VERAASGKILASFFKLHPSVNDLNDINSV